MSLFKKILVLFGSTLKKGESFAISTKKLAREIKDTDIIITEQYKLENIAKQFSDKISSELKMAEQRIKGIINNDTIEKDTEREMGMFL